MLNREIFQIASSAVVKNKMRSLLTVLGIIIGIMVVMLMQAAIGGFHGVVQKEVDKLGANGFIISRWPAMNFGNGWQKYEKRKKITDDYADQLKAGCPSVLDIVPLDSRWGNEVRAGKLKTDANISVEGAVSSWLKLSGREIEKGRFFSAVEQQLGTATAVIGSDVATTLFPNQNPLGREILVKGQKLLVIGVFVEKGAFMGEKQDAFLAVPWKTYQKIFGKQKNVALLVMAKSTNLLAKAMDEVTVNMRMLRRVKIEDENDFEIITKESLSDKINSIINMIYLAAIAIGGMSILVGSIGIMNIMLVSVTERTKEIGIRRSMGATKSTIARQFLLEAVMLSVAGGLTGVILGYSIATAVAHFTGFNTAVPIWVVIASLSISVLIGIASGFYPAKKAAGLHPVDALRYE